MIERSIMEFGAVADGITDDAAAIQGAVDAVHSAGGGRVLVPSGADVLAGSIELKSRVDFHVADGAVLRCATNEAAFPRKVFGSGEESEKRLWIGARHASGIVLSGNGTIDGQCRAFALGEEEHIFRPTLPWRPAMTCFEDVANITVRDLTFRDSANWTLHFTGCRDVHVHDVRIFNNLKFPNADGIDPDHCQRVRIERCHIVAADDCIVLKNTEQFKSYGPCEDIFISRCRLESISAAFKIGSESHGEFRRIRMSDCVIERSNRGLALQIRDGGSVEDVILENITVETRRYSPDFWGAAEPVYVTILPRSERTPPGKIAGLLFSNIRCTSENGVVVFGEPDGAIQNVRFQNLHLEIKNPVNREPGVLDLRPFQGNYSPGHGEVSSPKTPWGYTVSSQPAAFLLRGAREMVFDHVEVSLPPDPSWIPISAEEKCGGKQGKAEQSHGEWRTMHFVVSTRSQLHGEKGVEN